MNKKCKTLVCLSCGNESSEAKDKRSPAAQRVCVDRPGGRMFGRETSSYFVTLAEGATTFTRDYL